ncbi:MAG: PDZ domain-containing protein [Luteitalea sp.]|nr:PDZ domain-containing protein [Luteitalea sp.]
MHAPCLRLSLLLTACLMTMASDLAGQAATPEPIRYTVRFAAPQTHYVDVEATYPTDSRPDIELMMAVWTPGSYLVREYSRHVEDLTARAPTGTLAVEKTRKNRWRVATDGAASITVHYRVYAREMSVRTNWVEAGFALLNGAPTFITLVETDVRRPHDVALSLPAGWRTTMTGLASAPDGAPHHYVAPDFDTLVDSPIVAGNPAVYEFEVGGKQHFLVNDGEGGVWDGPRSARDVEQIVRATERLWGMLPYEKYVFLNLLTEAGGGLEHKNSTTLMASRWATRTRERYRSWLGLVSHELFHTWNIKRLRPRELGPFDYENEVHTTGLWMGEGFTSYYGDLLVCRAGLTTDDEYLRDLSAAIKGLQTTPGRAVQPVSSASYDAWIKYYRRDENTDNTTISYYTKGAIVAFLLDAKIRQATNGRQSLDDAMRLAYERFSGSRGYTQAELRRTFTEVAGVDLASWLRDALDTTKELDYSAALEWYGLRFKPTDPNRQPKAWIGADTSVDGGRLLVAEVPRGTPAHDGGLNVDDEIMAIDEFRVRPERAQLDRRLESYQPGDKVSVLVARRDALMHLNLTLGEEPAPDRWTLEVDPDATDAERANLRAWLNGSEPDARTAGRGAL